LKARGLVLAAALALTAAGGVIVLRGTERDFQASGELDEFVVFVELSSGARLAVSDAVVKKIEHAIQANPAVGPAVQTLVSRVEGWSSKIYVTLRPRAERRLTTEQVLTALRSALKDVGRDDDGNAFIHFSSARSGQELTLQIMGPDYGVMEQLAQKISDGLGRVKGLEDVKMRYRPGRPEVRAIVDPDRAARAGLTVEEVAETAHGALRGLRASAFHVQGEQREIIVRLRASDRSDLEQLADVPILTRSGRPVRLGDVATLRLGTMPNEVFRENKERLLQITANRRGISLGRAAQAAQAVIDATAFPLGYHADLEGSVRDMSRAFRQLSLGVAVMVLLVYLTLILLFESLMEPLIIMTTVPLCLIGAAWGLVVFRVPLSTGVLVGLLMLGGVVVNNAIMLIDRLNALKADGGSLADRLRDSVLSRTHPIFLTAGSAVLGFLPMMLDTSESGVVWRPLAITMVFGLMASTLLTLFVVPCLTVFLLDDLPRLLTRRSEPAAAPAVDA
jgi:HAE1 family hydrophobic/amphiphilic exporter-1